MALKPCRECKKEISTQAKACPHCGATNPTTAPGVAALATILILGIVGYVLYSVFGTASAVSTALNPSSANSNATAAQDFTVVDWDWKRNEYGSLSIVGSVRNNTGRKYGYVQIQFNLYDKSGAQVGSTLANVNNLEPYATWRFEAAVLEGHVAKASVQGVTGF